MISIEEIFSDNYIKAFGGITEVRAALTMARIHQHMGDSTLAHAFATAGLANLGRATILEPQFREILARI